MGTIGVPRLCIGFLAASLLGASATGAFAQNSPSPSPGDQTSNGAPKAHARKTAHGVGSHTTATQPNSEETERAAHIAAARKKFFEQSDGFDNATPGAVFLGGGNGLTPGAGFRF
jgi:hypothetical protein